MTHFSLIVCVSILLLVSLGISLHVRIMRSLRISRVGGWLAIGNDGLPQYVKISESVRLLDTLPAHLIVQLLLHEDDRFFVHKGFNVPEMMRSLQIMIKTRRRKGGSSITQQLARVLFCPEHGRPSSILGRKVKECIVTVYLERYLSKWEILALYCNHIAVWLGTRGIQEAALVLFRKAPAAITIPEGEILVSLITGKYLGKTFSQSSWETSVFNLHLSYEKLLALQRWFVKTFPERDFSILADLPLNHKELRDALMKEPPRNREMGVDKEFQFQQNNVQAIDAIRTQLPQSPSPIVLSHRYLPTPLAVIANLVTIGQRGRVSEFQHHLLSCVEDRDYTEIELLLQRQMVAGLLSTVVDSCPLPPRFFSKLEELRVAEISQHLRLKSAFVGLQKLLDSKVDVINVKGIDLHERFYGDNLVRSARDIDILVADEAYVLLAQCLREAGYQKQINTSDERDLRIARWTGEPVVWMDPKLHVPIDVHILRASHYATLHKHSERIEMKAPFTQVMYRGLDRIELLKYLCQHAAKHGWSKIQWITDICRVLLTLPRDELLRLLSKEGQSQADFNMLLGFFLVQHIIIGTYGAHFSIIPPYRSTIYSLARIVLSQTMMSRKNSFAGWTKIRYLWLSNRSFLARMRCILSYLFTPTPQDIPLSNGKLSWHCLVLRGLMRPVLGVIRFCSQ